jgi:hypothetical protein
MAKRVATDAMAGTSGGGPDPLAGAAIKCPQWALSANVKPLLLRHSNNMAAQRRIAARPARPLHYRLRAAVKPHPDPSLSNKFHADLGGR